MSKRALLFLLIGIIAGISGTWIFLKQDKDPAQSTGRKPLYYQSSMHPWIKSDRPGKCTICGMDLTPVFEGESGFDAEGNLVKLPASTVQVINVDTTPVQSRELTRTLRVSGTVDDDDTEHRIVSAYVDGRVDKLAVNYVGAEVVRGELLAVMYSPTLLAAEREYLSLLGNAPEDKDSNFFRQHERLIKSARHRLRQFGLSEEQIDKLDSKKQPDIHSEILAPLSGTVIERAVYEGQYVKEGDKLFVISDFSKMWFVFDVYEQDLSWLQVGQKVEITTPSLPGKQITAPITFIDPNINEMTRSAKVRVELENPSVEENGRKRRLLLHRLYADGKVQVDTPKVLAIPRSAVLSPGGKPRVYVDRGEGAYEPRQVRLGRRGDQWWEVLEGVEEGEQVVTRGNFLIDSQAQLNESSHSGHSEHDHGPAPAPSSHEGHDLKPITLSDEEKAAAEKLIGMFDSIAAALAADDLGGYQNATERWKREASNPINLLAKRDELSSWMKAIESAPPAVDSKNLEEARASFVPFTKAFSDWAVHMKKAAPSFMSFKVYRCPMVNQAVEGAPKIGFWVQKKAPLRNPFFGADMLECGTEVK